MRRFTTKKIKKKLIEFESEIHKKLITYKRLKYYSPMIRFETTNLNLGLIQQDTSRMTYFFIPIIALKIIFASLT